MGDGPGPAKPADAGVMARGRARVARVPGVVGVVGEFRYLCHCRVCSRATYASTVAEHLTSEHTASGAHRWESLLMLQHESRD